MKYTIPLLVASTTLVSAVPAIQRRQGVTDQISPDGDIPSGCTLTMPVTFGITVRNLTKTDDTADVEQIEDGQIQAVNNDSPISQIDDGQIQAQDAPAVSQIDDGQIQAPTADAVSQIDDGQIQAPIVNAVSQIDDGQIQAPTVDAVSQIDDGQIQAPTADAVSQINDGQIQAPTADAVSQIDDGQVQSETDSTFSAMQKNMPVACLSDNTLQLKLDNGVLTDNKDRIGYIASNRQFQFDGPPQAGAIFTAGFSVCEESGVLALGNSTVFRQCLSGDFYNLYDENDAAQCNEVELVVTRLVPC